MLTQTTVSTVVAHMGAGFQVSRHALERIYFSCRNWPSALPRLYEDKPLTQGAAAPIACHRAPAKPSLRAEMKVRVRDGSSLVFG